MNRSILVAIIALAIGCADTVVGPSDGGTPTIDRNPTPDVSEDVTPSDLGSPDVFQSDADLLDQGVIDGGVPQDVAADISTMDTAGLFTDAQVTDPECNDLFPALPITGAMHDEAVPTEFRGGEIPDGTYHLVQRDFYRSLNPVARFYGRTIVVRGDTHQIVSLGTSNEDFSRAYIRRSTCIVIRPMSPETPFCRFTCPSKLREVQAFFPHEMRGSQLVVASGAEIQTYDRVAP